jgi:hypothetical protein
VEPSKNRLQPREVFVSHAIHASARQRPAPPNRGDRSTPACSSLSTRPATSSGYPRLPHRLTTARGNGIQLLLIYHDHAQVEHLYGGRKVAHTVVSNAKMRMLLPGVGAIETLRYWSDLIGQTRRHSHGTATGSDGQALFLYQNLPPARVRLLPWYADRRLRHLNQ